MNGVDSSSVTTPVLDGPALVIVIVKVAEPPGVTAAGPIIETWRSADAVTSTDAAAVLLEGSGSVVSAAGATVAVLTRDPSADAATIPVAMNVAVPPVDNVTVVPIAP